MTDEIWDRHEASLITDAYRAHEQFDKALLALSGGALGISFVFVRDIVGQNPGRGWNWLLVAWVMWTLSLTVTLASFLISANANWNELADCRRLRSGDRSKLSKPGGRWDAVIRASNPVAGLLFVVGVILLAVFVNLNMRGKP